MQEFDKILPVSEVKGLAVNNISNYKQIMLDNIGVQDTGITKEKTEKDSSLAQ